MWFAVLSLSSSALAGAAIGHPVPTENAFGTSLSYTWGALPVSTTVFDHCNGTYETVTVNETLDPVAGDPIVLPPGQICGLRINLSDRFLLSGTGPSNSTFSLSLGVTQINIPVSPAITVPSDGSSGGTQIRLAAPDWITATLLGLTPNANVTVGATHPLHNQLRDDVRYDSAAW
jgi:hypothetical protein